MKVGFVQHTGPQRIAIRNEQGVKLGYLAQVNGRQVFTDTDGRLLAMNIRMKQRHVNTRMSACGGSFVPEDRS